MAVEPSETLISVPPTTSQLVYVDNGRVPNESMPPVARTRLVGIDSPGENSAVVTMPTSVSLGEAEVVVIILAAEVIGVEEELEYLGGRDAVTVAVVMYSVTIPLVVVLDATLDARNEGIGIDS